MYIYPDNLTVKATLWLWTLRDLGLMGVGLLLSVLIFSQTASVIPLVLTVVYGFLAHAVSFFLTQQQYYEWRLDDVEEAGFYGTSYTESIPAEFRTHIPEMQEAFAKLDTAIGNANISSQEGGGVNLIQVKAIFYALCFGDQAPSRREARQFVVCFFGEEARTNTVVTEHQLKTVSDLFWCEYIINQVQQSTKG